MKRIVLLSVGVLLLITFSNAQVRQEIAMTYLGQVCDTSWNYRDVSITNVDNRSWPAVGIYTIKTSQYYSYSYYHGYCLQMIEVDTEIAAMRYTKYYIYDDFQNLKYFVYQCEEFGGVVMKFDGDKSEIIDKSEDTIIEENYFIDKESVIHPESILNSAGTLLADCVKKWGIPVYEERTKFIRQKYKEINETAGKLRGCSRFYQDDQLVKVIDSELNREYYLDNDILIFAYYPEADGSEDIRVYYYGQAYQVIVGKTKLSTLDDKFHEIGWSVTEDFEELIK